MIRHLAAVALAALGLATIGGCNVSIDSDKNVSEQLGSDSYRAGGFVNLTDAVEGDAFLAGGQVSTANEVGGDLVVAAGEISVGGSVGDDLYAAGGDVKVDAIIHGNARVGGGDVAFGPATVVAGSTTIAGGRIVFEGNSHGYLKLSGGSVTLGGQVHGDVDVRAEELTILPGTEVGGRLVYRGPTPPVVPEGAVIVGGVEYHEGGHGDSLTRDSGSGQGTHWFGSLLWFAGVFGMGALFLVLFPTMSARAVDVVGRDPWKALGVGLGVLVFNPLVAVVLVLTIAGIPLALLLVLVYLLVMFLGWIVGASFLGQKALSLAPGERPVTTQWRLIALLLALAVLAALDFVPFIGGLVHFVVLVAGMGALAAQGWTSRDATPSRG